MKLHIIFFVFCLVVMSCNEVTPKKLDPDRIVEEELQSINWNEVDSYPTFQQCDSLTDKSQENCFKNTISTHIYDYLARQQLIVTEDVSDTIELRIQIDKKGMAKLVELNLKDRTRELLPEIDSLFYNSIKMLPKIYPAIKRGQPVTTQFQLPVVITIQ